MRDNRNDPNASRILHALEQRAEAYTNGAAGRQDQEADEVPLTLIDLALGAGGTGAPADTANGVNGSANGRRAMGPDPEGKDATLGGYLAVHDRPPAFEGADGQPYTIAIDVDESDDPRGPWAAFLVFVRWAASGAGIMGHLESGDVAFGDTPEDAYRAALDLSLFEIRAELDAAIARREADADW